VPAILESLDPNFAAVLLNAVSLTARWEEPFNPTDTLEGEFTTTQGQKKQVPMMQRVGNFVVADGNGVRAIALPYADPAVEMIVMLPDDVDALSPQRVVQTFSGPIPAAWGGLAQTEPKRVRLLLPRFKCEFKADLSEAFKSMGMVRAFSPAKAEFSNMVAPSGGPVFIDKVLHRATIEVGELGTEAAAATAVVMAPGAGAADPAEQPLDFVVDRPFMFVIGDKRSGATLFAGIVADPTAESTNGEASPDSR
jgi:serpin B